MGSGSHHGPSPMACTKKRMFTCDGLASRRGDDGGGGGGGGGAGT